MLNLLASSPYSAFEVCVAYVEKAIRVPLGTRIGDSPSSPPPWGSAVVSTLIRQFKGMGGKRRNAEKLLARMCFGQYGGLTFGDEMTQGGHLT